MATSGVLKTEYEFSLPFGYVDRNGTMHRDGVMRIATARDEVEPMGDTRVIENQAYLPILLLSRVVSRLGEISPVTPAVVEGLFSPDFVYLQDLYVQINDLETGIVETQCPDCGNRFAIDVGEHGDG